ncbi:MAG: phosphoribosylanthranilate isomerase [Dehalococcoidia bacterium]
MTFVKICGNRTPEDVLAAAEAGADFVGMIFADSSRRVEVEDAQAMVRALGEPLARHELALPPPAFPHAREEVGPWFHHGTRVIAAYLEAKRPLTVGVFADQPVDEVNEIAEEAGIDLVQLSGDETWEDCLLVTKQVVQVVHVSPIDSPSDPMESVQPGFALALMLDAAHGPYRGGGGRPFDWEVARRVAERLPVMLAGGLTPENVGDALRGVHPWAVDVSSGTESDGRKDHAKVRAFVQAVRAADAEGER